MQLLQVNGQQQYTGFAFPFCQAKILGPEVIQKTDFT
jgi:hypothetical protein